MKKLIVYIFVVSLFSSCMVNKRSYRAPKTWHCVVGKVNYWNR